MVEFNNLSLIDQRRHRRFFRLLNLKIFFREGETKRTDTLAKQIRIHANNEFTFHSTLEHKNILPVFDFYRQQVDGVNYLVIVSQLCNMDFQQYLTFGLETFFIFFLIRNRSQQLSLRDHCVSKSF